MQSARVLLVEDEAIIAMELEERLGQLGHRIVGTAASAEDALALAARHQPDLALLDIHIQGRRDGIEVAELLAEQYGVPCIFLTAYADDSTLARARKAAPFGYIVKPLRERELVATIEMAIYRHRMERELREARDRFQRVVESVREGLLIDDLEGKVVFANDEFLRIFGLEQQDLGNLRLEDFVAPEWRAEMRDQHARRMAGEEVPADFEFQGLRKDGRRLWIDARVAVLREGGAISGTLSAIRDVTEARELREALARREQQLSTTQRQARIGGWSRDLRTDEVEISPELAEILGLQEAGAAGPSAALLAMLHPDDLPAVAALVEGLIAGSGPNETEMRAYRADGSLAYLLVRAEVQRGPDGQPVRIVGTSQDITERRLRELEVAEFEQQMAQVQRLESLGVLAGGIAHDFNNLLTAILGNLTLARLELGEACPVNELLQEAEAASQRAAELCRQMLAYSGRGRFVIEAVDISALVREMSAILDVSVGRQVHLRLELATELPRVRADSTQLRQIVMNLITNASDALGEQSGEIVLRTGCEELGPGRKVAFSAEDLPPGPYVYVEVEDNGPGMDEATLARIFEPFYSTKFTGRGLGLAAVGGILRSHHGAIHVRSSPGAGACFRVWLPVPDGPLGPIEPAAAEIKAAPALRGRVLLVEGSGPVRAMTANMLARMGLQVSDFPSGAEALAAQWPSGPPDYAVLDLSMPGMDGITLFGRLRARFPGLPVVLTSGYSAQELPPEVGADPRCIFVEKPYNDQSLRAALLSLSGSA